MSCDHDKWDHKTHFAMCWIWDYPSIGGVKWYHLHETTELLPGNTTPVSSVIADSEESLPFSYDPHQGVRLAVPAFDYECPKCDGAIVPGLHVVPDYCMANILPSTLNALKTEGWCNECGHIDESMWVDIDRAAYIGKGIADRFLKQDPIYDRVYESVLGEKLSDVTKFVVHTCRNEHCDRPQTMIIPEALHILACDMDVGRMFCSCGDCVARFYSTSVDNGVRVTYIPEDGE